MQEKLNLKEQSILSLGMDGPSVHLFIIQAKTCRAQEKKQAFD